MLFAAWWLAGLVADGLFPQAVVGRQVESLSADVGSTVGVLLASILLRRYVVRSFWLAVACITTTEVAVLLIISKVAGLPSFSYLDMFVSDMAFNLGWLFDVTWNVIAAFAIGSLIGHFWDRRARLRVSRSEDKACPEWHCRRQPLSGHTVTVF